MNLFYLVFAPSQYAVVFLEVIISAVGAAYAAPRKIKFSTELKLCFCGILTPVFQFKKKELVFF